MERLVKKLEREGFNANKELALTLHSALSSSRRRKDWLLIGLPTLLLLLSVTQKLRAGIAVVIVSLILLGLWVATVILHVKETRLRRRLAAVIAETQYVNTVYIDDLVSYATTGALFVVAFLVFR